MIITTDRIQSIENSLTKLYLLLIIRIRKRNIPFASGIPFVREEEVKTMVLCL
jgi:hypothetical protein